MSLTNKDILEAISKMNVLELIELTKLIEKKFNISTTLLTANQTEQKEKKQEEKPEQTKFSVIMTNYGASKINIIKIIRTLLNLGLKEAKNFVETTPATIKTNLQKTDAEKIKKQLTDAGAIIELK